MAQGEPMFETLKFTAGQPEVDMISTIERQITDAPAVAEVAYTGTPRFTGERGAISRNVALLTVGLIGGAGVLGFGGLKAFSGDTTPSGHTERVSEDALKDISCKGGKFVVSSNNPDKFDKDAFLPHNGSKNVDSQKSAETYIRSLFDKNGPLAKGIDKHSLAAIMAAVVDPSHDGKAVETGFNYKEAYRSNLARYEAPDGLKAATADCEKTMETLLQTSGFVRAGLREGSKVMNFRPVRDVDNSDESKRNNITDDSEFVEVTIGKNINVIRLELRGTTKGLDGFISLDIDPEDGNMYLEGVPVPTEVSGEAEADDQEGEILQPKARSKKGGGGTFGNSNGNGESDRAGDVPETGGNAGHTPGTAPSFGNGGGSTTPTTSGSGGNGGGTPPPPPPPETTTTTRPSPTTTQPPTKPPMDDCDPNIDVC